MAPVRVHAALVAVAIGRTALAVVRLRRVLWRAQGDVDDVLERLEERLRLTYYRRTLPWRVVGDVRPEVLEHVQREVDTMDIAERVRLRLIAGGADDYGHRRFDGDPWERWPR